MIEIVLNSGITLSEAKCVITLVKSRHEDAVRVVGQSQVGMASAALTGVEIIGVAGAIGAVISAVVCVQNQNEQRNKWTRARMIQTVENEMLEMGVTEFTVKSIHNYTALVQRKHTPCRVVVADKTSDAEYKMFIYRDGSAFSVRLSRDET